MSRECPRIAGVSAFGLGDVVTIGDVAREEPFGLASVILPGRPHGSMVAGDRAGRDRMHSGLPWPPEAQVVKDGLLRRVPVSLAWRALVEAGERPARWNIGEGVSFPLSRILAAHVAGLFLKEKERSAVSPVLVIPNDLDEFGQEGLLNELRQQGFFEPQLLWRPVAEALSWLAEAGQEMVPQRLKVDDFLLVLSLFPDAIEFVPFRLKAKKHPDDGLWYILPRRERPVAMAPLTGFDWVGAALEHGGLVASEDHGAFWQSFAGFPELWLALAGRPWVEETLPRIWGKRDGWDYWNPCRNEVEKVLGSTPCIPSKQLRELLRKSCPLSDGMIAGDSWPATLAKQLRQTLASGPEGRLVGLVICGPLAPDVPPGWVHDCFPEIQARGLDTGPPYDQQQQKRIWCDPGSGAIAHGAALYGQRLQAGKPTYLDTLPQISLVAKRGAAYQLFPLVDAQDVPGGEPYTKMLEHQFSLAVGKSRLDIILMKGNSKEGSLCTLPFSDRLDEHVCTLAEGLTLGQSALIRWLVRNSSTHVSESPQSSLPFPQEPLTPPLLQHLCRQYPSHRKALSDYFGSFSRLYSGGSYPTSAAGKYKCPPLRQAPFNFPVPTPRDMPVDIKVSIRPVSGRAQLEVVPEDPAFLQGRRVFVDYDRMSELKELPGGDQGWHPLKELSPYPYDDWWGENRPAIEQFCKARVEDRQFASWLYKVEKLLQGKQKFRIRFAPVNQEGKAGSPASCEAVVLLADGFRRHFDAILSLPGGTHVEPRRLVSCCSRLFVATPENIRDTLRKVVQERLSVIPWSYAVDAAGRAFHSPDDLNLLFHAIARRIRSDCSTPFPIQSARAISRVLMYRPHGQDALDGKIALLFLRQTCRSLNEQARKDNFETTFFQEIQLLLFLLRYRKKDSDFLKASSGDASELIDQLDEHLKKMKMVQSRRVKKKVDRAEKVIQGVKDFVNFKGKIETIEVLDKLADDENDDDAGDDR